MQFNVDPTDPRSIEAAFDQLVQLRRKFRDTSSANLSNARLVKREAGMRRESLAIRAIFDADMSSLFPNEEGEHYVYAHCSATPLNAGTNARHLLAAELGMQTVPFYIGKGAGSRSEDLNRNEGHRKIRQHLIREGKDINVFKIQTGLSEEAAFGLEGKLIDIFGLKYFSPLGLLVNLDEGLFAKERRQLYPKGSNWYLNRIKIQPHGVPQKG